MARDDAQPDNPDGDAGHILNWEMTLPGISDRFWRAMGPNQIRWLVTRQPDGKWGVSRYPSSAPNPEHVAEVESLKAGQQLAETFALDDAAEHGFSSPPD